jgi:hypothetical protein
LKTCIHDLILYFYFFADARLASVSLSQYG